MVDITNIEFYREGYGMLADPRDKDPGAPVCFPRNHGGRVMTGFCSCRASHKGSACIHLSQLVTFASEIRKQKNKHPGAALAGTVWPRLAAVLSEGDPIACTNANARQLQSPHGRMFVFTRYGDTLLARLLDDSPASVRFLERTGHLPSSKPGMLTRADLIHKLAANLCSEEERLMNKAGMLTRRQAAEQSFWGRLAYHAVREYGGDFAFRPAVDLATGDFILICLAAKTRPVFELSIPRSRVRKVLAFLAAEFPNDPAFAIHPVPLKSIFRVTQKTKLDLEVRPAILALQSSGEAQFFKSVDFTKFRYGDLVYIKELKVLAELEQPDGERKFASPTSMRLKKSQLPAFLSEHQQQIEQGDIVLDGELRDLSIFREFDGMEIRLDALRRSWYWLSVSYGIGSEKVSLADILKARKEGAAFLQIKNGWVDVHSEAFNALEYLEQQKASGEKGDGRSVPVSAVNLLRLTSLAGKQIRIKGRDARSRLLQQLLAFKPARPWDAAEALATPLRPYQVKGVDWLRFLSENELGGLLCDDMGLGKTHQTMALMTWLKEQAEGKPFLVVCPTTVMSHWQNKIRDHAPSLAAIQYHGDKRSVDQLGAGDVLLTSYGVLRNDILTLKDISFSLAVFDEIQNLKNRETQSYQAAALIQARMRLGLTGTPIENSLAELKSLFDLVLPGYLESDRVFEERYAAAGSEAESQPGLQRLRRMIAPFTLRRLKQDVLEDLPEKIEDLRTCRLSDMQVKLYREVLETRGSSLISQLESDDRRLPYIHIFAVLNHLKRICDHPALALGRIEDYQNFESGKWELFQELLFETLDSGRKIVVFTQYLGMIAMMERLLQERGIEFVTLTGSSQARGEIVRRFNSDADCRVFLGSLKAGGTGIDLVGGSTVLHYDRWWNAAREDQATDRVHRIGQKQAVQVFKLITEGTLEEKIAAIIERKRRLMNTVVQADDPSLDKIFTREELIELLKPCD